MGIIAVVQVKKNTQKRTNSGSETDSSAKRIGMVAYLVYWAIVTEHCLLKELHQLLI